jgi:hypothetical protein
VRRSLFPLPGLGPLRVAGSAYRRCSMAPMPKSGEPCPGFIAEADRCWRRVYSRQLQATHCQEGPSWTRRWFSPSGDRWFRVFGRVPTISTG